MRPERALASWAFGLGGREKSARFPLLIRRRAENDDGICRSPAREIGADDGNRTCVFSLGSASRLNASSQRAGCFTCSEVVFERVGSVPDCSLFRIVLGANEARRMTWRATSAAASTHVSAREGSVDRAEADSSDRLEVLSISRDNAESSLKCRRCDQSIGKARPRLPCNSSCSFCNRSINLDFTEWCQQPGTEISCRVAGKKLGSGHDRIVHAMFPGAELIRSP